jgi:hypothetical protein
MGFLLLLFDTEQVYLIMELVRNCFYASPLASQVLAIAYSSHSSVVPDVVTSKEFRKHSLLYYTCIKKSVFANIINNTETLMHSLVYCIHSQFLLI